MQGTAYAALAAAYQKQGDITSAVDCLEKFLHVAQDTENRRMQAEACANLGAIFNAQQRFADAVKSFDQAYDLTRAMLTDGEGAG